VKMTTSQRNLRWGALLLLLVLPGLSAHARSRTRHSQAWARERFVSAERMREALNGRPPTERTRHEYQRVIDAYRSVYFGAPTSAKADPSVVAVAETLVEMGRHFEDDKILNGAIAQYKFLRKEYPGSKYRCDALFTIGEIYKDDLNDADQARAVFQEFLHRYPQNRLAEDAQQAVLEMDREAENERKAEARKQKKAGKETADKNKNKSTENSQAKGNDALAEVPADLRSNLKTDAASPESSETRLDHTYPEHNARVTGIRH
jgi:N-acetylmuramoyl-L-alanine amidase